MVSGPYRLAPVRGPRPVKRSALRRIWAAARRPYPFSFAFRDASGPRPAAQFILGLGALALYGAGWYVASAFAWASVALLTRPTFDVLRISRRLLVARRAMRRWRIWACDCHLCGGASVAITPKKPRRSTALRLLRAGRPRTLRGPTAGAIFVFCLFGSTMTMLLLSAAVGSFAPMSSVPPLLVVTTLGALAIRGYARLVEARRAISTVGPEDIRRDVARMTEEERNAALPPWLRRRGTGGAISHTPRSAVNVTATTFRGLAAARELARTGDVEAYARADKAPVTVRLGDEDERQAARSIVDRRGTERTG